MFVECLGVCLLVVDTEFHNVGLGHIGEELASIMIQDHRQQLRLPLPSSTRILLPRSSAKHFSFQSS